MQDFSSVNIKNMIIHNVGNKVKGESLDLSTEICDTNNKVTNQYLKQFFFSTFKFDITYRFVHETDIAMNEIYNYVKHIGDRIDNDIVPAKQLGMKTIWVKQGLGSLWNITDESEKADMEINNLSDVLKYL